MSKVIRKATIKSVKKLVFPILILLLIVFVVGCQALEPSQDLEPSTIPSQEGSDTEQPYSEQPDSKPASAKPSVLFSPTVEPIGTEAPTESEEPFGEDYSREVKIVLTEAYPLLSFNSPLEFVHAVDDSDRIFVVEKDGRILVFSNNPEADEAKVFLDLTAKVDNRASEKGLLGLAFHPDYTRNGYFFVNYTDREGTVIARYKVEQNDPDMGLADSEEVLLTFSQPYNNHNGGRIEFGKDGHLYIATGDGGSGGDPQNNSQNRSNLLGKILRIDVDNPKQGALYGIPADNPFVGNDQGFREEIYAYGLRNPWKFSFDYHRNWLWAADVGQNKIEEINIIKKGENYGWNIMEGSQIYSSQVGVNQEDLVLPVWEYEHPIGKSITGGFVYYGDEIPGLRGAYVYGDFVTGMIWALWLDEDLSADNRLLLETDLMISSFGLDQNNEMYVVDFNGKIYRLSQKS
ncbi:MAG: PQQ-dependent sugar dehydrogenase [Clostridiales bacterium]|nr:PQQ-dependent sugar dehydrogenase [Clostridiales bacterium]